MSKWWNLPHTRWQYVTFVWNNLTKTWHILLHELLGFIICIYMRWVLLGGLRVTNPTIGLACPSVGQHFACKHENSTNISDIVSKRIPWMYLRSVLVKFEHGWPWPIFEVMGVNLNMQIYTCKHDNSTNISRIGSKLIPWIYLRSVLVKFEDGWPWPICRGHGGWFQHEN